MAPPSAGPAGFPVGYLLQLLEPQWDPAGSARWRTTWAAAVDLDRAADRAAWSAHVNFDNSAGWFRYALVGGDEFVYWLTAEAWAQVRAARFSVSLVAEGEWGVMEVLDVHADGGADRSVI